MRSTTRNTKTSPWSSLQSQLKKTVVRVATTHDLVSTAHARAVVCPGLPPPAAAAAAAAAAQRSRDTENARCHPVLFTSIDYRHPMTCESRM